MCNIVKKLKSITQITIPNDPVFNFWYLRVIKPLQTGAYFWACLEDKPFHITCVRLSLISKFRNPNYYNRQIDLISQKLQENKHVAFWNEKKKLNTLTFEWKPRIYEEFLKSTRW